MKRGFLAALSVAVLGAASTAHAESGGRTVHFGGQLGFTSGGDVLHSEQLTSGGTDTVRAGALFHVAGTVQWRPKDWPVSAQINAGYHVDTEVASNGDMTFQRFPLELLGHWTGLGGLRLGGGLRYAVAPKLEIDSPNTSLREVEFKAPLGFVAEIGYRFVPSAWVTLRGTFEDYEVKSVNGVAASSYVTNGKRISKVNGNSIGIYVGAAF